MRHRWRKRFLFWWDWSSYKWLIGRVCTLASRCAKQCTSWLLIRYHLLSKRWWAPCDYDTFWCRFSIPRHLSRRSTNLRKSELFSIHAHIYSLLLLNFVCNVLYSMPTDDTAWKYRNQNRKLENIMKITALSACYSLLLCFIRFIHEIPLFREHLFLWVQLCLCLIWTHRTFSSSLTHTFYLWWMA